MKKPVDYFYMGRDDGVNNKPRQKGLKGFNKKCYDNGYQEGQSDRTYWNTRKKKEILDEKRINK